MRYFWLIIFVIFVSVQFYYTKNYYLLIYVFVIITETLAVYGLSDDLSKAKKQLKILNDFQNKWNNFEGHEANLINNKNNPKRKDD